MKKTFKPPRPPKGYLYCKKCNIFFSDKLKAKADKRRKKAEKIEPVSLRLMNLSMIRDCPICSYQESMSMIRAFSSMSSLHDRPYISYRDRERIRDTSRKRGKSLRLIQKCRVK